MTEPVVPEKVDPESLVLRAKPRRIVRIKRNLLIGLCAVGCVAVSGLVWLGLNPISFTPTMPATSDKDPEKHRSGVPEQISTLPKTYADVPALGQPLPGDLGRPILEAQQAHALAGGTGAGPNSVSVTGGGPAQTARISGLFFQVANATNASTGSDASVRAASSLSLMPMAAPASTAPVQPEKVAFLESGSRTGSVNPHTVRAPASPSMIMAGTVISAALITGLNSDIPGTALAQVTSDVHDTLTGRVTLIPAGARLLGKYDTTVTFGQKRVLIVWQRILWPDGRSIEIDNLPASDLSGFSGLQDRVSFHTLSLLKGIGLSTLLGISGELGKSDSDDDLAQALRDSVQQTANQAGQKIVARDLDVQPSLTVRPGWPLRVIVQKDIDVSSKLTGDVQ
jgi:type IV secretion system protein VirB10